MNEEKLQWTMCKDKLPPIHSRVLVCCQGGHIETSFVFHPEFFKGPVYGENRKSPGKYSKFFEIAWKYDYVIIAWMPLPKPPEECKKYETRLDDRYVDEFLNLSLNKRFELLNLVKEKS